MKNKSDKMELWVSRSRSLNLISVLISVLTSVLITVLITVLIVLNLAHTQRAYAQQGEEGEDWIQVRPGIERNRAEIFGLVAHTILVDLTRPELKIRVARQTDGTGFMTTDAWAQEVGAIVAINGDWSDVGGARGAEHPLGLSIGDGVHWPNTVDLDHWRFMACTVEKLCFFDHEDQAQELHWTWRNVLGGNFVLLVVDGQVIEVNNDPFYDDDTIHRSAIGISEDQNTLYLVLSEASVRGRRSTGGVGLTWNEVAQWIFDQGAELLLL